MPVPPGELLCGENVNMGFAGLYGCRDFLNDYEGIAGYEEFRGDLVLKCFATVDPSAGKLQRLADDSA
jgi:hypothetical protein